MEITHHPHGLATAVTGDVLVLHYVRTPTLSTAEVVERVVVHAIHERRRIGILVLIDADQPVPDASTRDQLSRLMKVHEHGIAAMAQVAAGSGFATAAVRAVLAGMTLFAHAQYPIRVFGSTAAAATWLVSKGLRCDAAGSLERELAVA